MILKNTVIIIVLVIAVYSCNTKHFIGNNNVPEKNHIEGIVYATKYKIPIESKIEIFKNWKFISSSISDKKGFFKIELDDKLYEDKLTALITPIIDHASIDTSFSFVYKVMAECKQYNPNREFKTDTFSIVFNKNTTQLNFLLSSCQPNRYTNMEEE